MKRLWTYLAVEFGPIFAAVVGLMGAGDPYSVARAHPVATLGAATAYVTLRGMIDRWIVDPETRVVRKIGEDRRSATRNGRGTGRRSDAGGRP